MTHWCVVQLWTPDRTKLYSGTRTKVKIKRLFLNCWCLLVPRPVTAGHVRDSQNCKSISMEMDCLCPVMLWGLQGWASLQQTFVFAWTLVRKPHYSPNTPFLKEVFTCCIQNSMNHSNWNTSQRNKLSLKKHLNVLLIKGPRQQKSILKGLYCQHSELCFHLCQLKYDSYPD